MSSENKRASDRRFQSKKKTKKQKQKDSAIHFIKLPPVPYSYVPGLGYISRPPSFSATALAAPSRKENAPGKPIGIDPVIKLPIDFVSNGKPVSVKHWPSPIRPEDEQPGGPSSRKPDSPIVRLDRGPYAFNGKPTGVYDLKRTPRPTGPNLV